MEYTKLGRIRPVYKGTWSASTAYTALDIVKNSAGDRAYIALKDVPKAVALTDAAYWGAVLDVSAVLAAADAAISAANEAARLAPNPLALTEKSQPAVIWPEEESPLRPKITMLPMQGGSGDPSPDNVRPISGRTAVKVTTCGKNLCPEWEQGAISGTTGANQSSENAIRTAGYVCVVPGGTYTLSRIGTANSLAVRGYDAGKNYIGSGPAVIRTLSGGNDTNPLNATQNTAVIQVLSGCCYLRFTDYANDLTNRYQLEVGSVATDYEPYQGETFTLALGQTVYGGILDAASGTLTVTHKLIRMSELSWKKSSAADMRYLGTNALTIKPGTAPICNIMPGGVWGNTSEQWVVYNDANKFIVNTDLATVDEFTAWLNEHDAWVCYETSEPVIISLSPVQIAALEGLNTVSSTGEGMELTYNKSLVREHGELLARLAALENAAVNNA